MRKLLYPACFYPCEEREGYTVVVPDLPGCVTQGNSLIDAIGMAVMPLLAGFLTKWKMATLFHQPAR